jgi:hypothetical protein
MMHGYRCCREPSNMRWDRHLVVVDYRCCAIINVNVPKEKTWIPD